MEPVMSGDLEQPIVRNIIASQFAAARQNKNKGNEMFAATKAIGHNIINELN